MSLDVYIVKPIHRDLVVKSTSGLYEYESLSGNLCFPIADVRLVIGDEAIRNKVEFLEHIYLGNSYQTTFDGQPRYRRMGLLINGYDNLCEMLYDLASEELVSRFCYCLDAVRNGKKDYMVFII